jgi:Leucine-rich repeat (LRR) protein
MNSNDLYGSIPFSIGKLLSIQEISLYSNKFTGTLPDSLSNLHHLILLDVEDNEMNGIIPASICLLSGLQYLYAEENQFICYDPCINSMLSTVSSLGCSACTPSTLLSLTPTASPTSFPRKMKLALSEKGFLLIFIGFLSLLSLLVRAE